WTLNRDDVRGWRVKLRGGPGGAAGVGGAPGTGPATPGTCTRGSGVPGGTAGGGSGRPGGTGGPTNVGGCSDGTPWSGVAPDGPAGAGGTTALLGGGGGAMPAACWTPGAGAVAAVRMNRARRKNGSAP